MMPERPAVRRILPHGRPFPLHVPLLTTVPALALWQGNADQMRSLYPVRIAIACGVVTCVIWAIGLVVQRDVRRAGLFASLVATAACTLGFILTDPTRAVVNLAVFGTAAAAIAILAIRLRDSAMRHLTILLNVVSVTLVAANGAAIALNRPADFNPTAATAVGAAPGRDVWYLVPDRFPTEHTLQSLGFDLSDFFDGLDERGFDIVDQARANYPQTSLSLGSAWDLDYFDFDPLHVDFGEALGRLEDPRIGRLFDEAGYHYTHLGSWPEFSAHSASADTVLTLEGAGEFWTAWEATTLLPTIRFLLDAGTPGTVSHARQVEHSRHQLRRLDAMARSEPDEPEFVMAHLVLPHGPYIYRADGSLRSRTDQVEDRTGYEQQAQYFGTRLLELIDVLQSREHPPVIMIVADEGLYPEDLATHASLGDVDPADYSPGDIRKKMSILAAVAAPEPIADLPEKTTAVNVVRRVVASTLSIDLPPLPDESFRWAGTSRDQVVSIPPDVLWDAEDEG